jgi:TolB protein
MLIRSRVVVLLAFGAGLAAGADTPPPRRLTFDGLDKQRPSWSPDGETLLFARHEAGGTAVWLYTMRADEPRSLHRLTTRKEPEYNGVFAPDGGRVLFAAIALSGTQGNLDIAAVRADGSGLRKLVGDPGAKLSHQDWPAWSPDCKRFAFTSTHDGNQEVYIANVDGSHVTRVTTHPGIDTHPCWAPDGRTVAFATDRWGGLELARADPDGTAVRRLTSSPGLDDQAAFSPDGKRLAFVSNRDGQFEIYVADGDGRNPRDVSRHPSRDTHPAWTPDGRGVTFVSDRDGGGDLYTVTVADGQ